MVAGLIELFTNDKTVWVLFWAILAFALLFYLFWYRRAVKRVISRVRRIHSALTKGEGDWPETAENVKSVVRDCSEFYNCWRDTEARIIVVPTASGERRIMMGSPTDIWNSSALLSRHFNFGLAESVPNILVGIGLFFTFSFLSFALLETNGVFIESDASASDTEQAISKLLASAGGKFWTSLAGLLSSICWTFFAKVMVQKLNRACEEMLDALCSLVPPSGMEELLRRQVELASSEIDVSEELLLEAREQTGTFKRFETDLALSLAGAIAKSVTPQMEDMTNRLVKAVEGLSDRLGSMNQDALEKMLNDFAAMLKQATESEMAQLQKTLQELSRSLAGASVKLTDGVAGAAQSISDAGTQLVSRVQEISQNLVVGANNLETAANGVKLAMNDLEITIEEAAGLGRRGADFLSEALVKTDETVQRLETVVSRLSESAQALGTVSGQISAVVDNVEELAREQRVVVNTVREVAPNAQAAVERVANILEVAGRETKDSIESTAAALSKTVSAITEGVSSYTDQVAALHRKMDENLAKAVGSLDKVVTDLTDSVEELVEKLPVSIRA